jgi:hypothetical protein
MSVAYLDPGSGSLIASVLVGGAAAAGVAVKTARARVSGAFSRKRKSDEPESTEVEADGAEGNGADPAETVDASPAAAADAPAEKAEAADTAKSDA